MTHITAMKLALDALHSIARAGLDLDEYVNNNLTSLQKVADDAIAALQAALAEPSAEPVAWTTDFDLENVKTGFATSLTGRAMRIKPAFPENQVRLLYTHRPVPEPLSEAQIRVEFAGLYPHDLALLELSEHNRDYAVEAIGARHHWAAFLAGARAIEAAIRSKT